VECHDGRVLHFDLPIKVGKVLQEEDDIEDPNVPNPLDKCLLPRPAAQDLQALD
jgi:hypothetical protein